MDSLYLIAAIALTSLGMLSMIAAAAPEASRWMHLVSWVIFTPAFYGLVYSMASYGVIGSFALWGAGTALIMVAQGVRWGDKLSTGQFVSVSTIVIGLIWLGVGG